MIYTHVAAVLISASFAFPAGWKVNQWRNDANQKQTIQQAALDKQELHRLEQARSSAALAVQVMARKSEARLRDDAAASKSALVGLQSSTDEALRTAALDNEACLAISHTLGELLDTSATRYRELGTKADQHLIDLKVQIDTP